MELLRCTAKRNDNYLDMMPDGILHLICEFDGWVWDMSQKLRYKSVCVKEFKKIVESEKCYRLAFRAAYQDEYQLGRHIKGIHFSSLKLNSLYNYILNHKKIASYCDCETSCCYRFQYDKEAEYQCRCHHKDRTGKVYNVHLYTYNKWIAVRTENTGFCVQIMETINDCD